MIPGSAGARRAAPPASAPIAAAPANCASAARLLRFASFILAVPRALWSQWSVEIRPAQGAAGPGVGRLALVEHEPAVDDHRDDALGVVERLEIRGPVDDAGRVEDRHVGKLPGAQEATIA